MSQNLLKSPLSRPVAAGLFALALLAGTAPAVRAQAGVGDPAPDFTFTNILPGPTTVTFSDYLGSVIVVTAFAYW